MIYSPNIICQAREGFVLLDTVVCVCAFSCMGSIKYAFKFVYSILMPQFSHEIF